MSDKKFIDGLWANKPHEKAPDFVKTELSIDLTRFGPWVKEWKQANPNEKYLKITVKESQKGEFYAEVNEWKPNPDAAKEAKAAAGGTPEYPEFDQDIPF